MTTTTPALTTPQDIKLSKPIKVNGTDVTALRMKEPTVADQLAADAVSGGDALKEVHLFANLCDVSPEDMKQLVLRDYKKLQETYLFFTTAS